MRTAAAFITELGQGFADALDKGTDLLLLSTTTAPLGWHLTGATGTPILQAGSAGLAADGDDVPTMGDVPHALLFPRLAAVVHHAGAGTSAAALRAGVPAVTVPVTADQPFRAMRLAALGAATDPIPFRSLTTERLADSLDRVVKQRARNRAAARAAKHLAAENGAGQTLKTIQQTTDG